MTAQPIVLAYADPPYPGFARALYDCDEINHAELVDRLVREYDGWALSTSAAALPAILRLCPLDVRVCSWVKKRRGGSEWEPLIVSEGRPRRRRDVSDVLTWGGRQHSHPGALVGMKPAPFCEWMFRQLGARRGDTFDDLYPGSGAVGRAWNLYTSQSSRRDAWRPAALDG